MAWPTCPLAIMLLTGSAREAYRGLAVVATVLMAAGSLLEA